MTKQVNYGLHETLEKSHRTLSNAVEMYAIYYSEWNESLQKLQEFYDSARWLDEDTNYYCDEHIFLVQERNRALRDVQGLGAQLRSIGLDVDLADWAKVDERFDEFDLDADKY